MRKYKVDTANKCLIQQPEMEKPVKKIFGIALDIDFDLRMRFYEQHLASLQTLPCPSMPESWKEGDIVSDKDFRLQHQYFIGEWKDVSEAVYKALLKNTDQCRIAAIPLPVEHIVKPAWWFDRICPEINEPCTRGFCRGACSIQEVDKHKPEGGWPASLEAPLKDEKNFHAPKVELPEWVIKLLVRERQRASDIAYEFMEKNKKQFESRQEAGSKVAFVSKDLANECRLIGNTITGLNALSATLGETTASILRKDYESLPTPLKDMEEKRSGIDLDKLEEQVDKVLSKETPASLDAWLKENRASKDMEGEVRGDAENPDTVEAVEQECIRFADWIQENGYTLVRSLELNKRAWVNCIENEVLVHGSDYHFTKLINEVGLTTKQLFTIFKNQKEDNTQL